MNSNLEGRDLGILAQIEDTHNFVGTDAGDATNNWHDCRVEGILTSR